MDWNAIITAISWVSFTLSTIAIVGALIYWNFILNSLQRSLYNFHIGNLYLIAIVSGIILYFG